VKPVLSRAEVRELDRRAESEAEIPTLALMERAGRGATAIIVEHFPTPRRAIIVCGAGNNGGDGFVVARLLCEHGWSPSVFLVGDPAKLRGDALHNSRLWAEAGASTTTVDESSLPELERALGDAELVVDALFGTGLDRELVALPRAAIELMNRAAAPKVALDLPSGIDADTGAPHGVAVRAEHTATFAAKKRGLLTPLGAAHAGDVHVVSLGIPEALVEHVGYGVTELEARDIAEAVPRRSPTSHKGESGRILILAGSQGKIGAGLLVAQGALRAGGGLVTLAAEPATAAVYEARVLEAMTARIDPADPEGSLAPYLERADAVALGPGFGLEAFSRRIVDHVALGWPGPVVLDADALTCFEGRAEALASARGQRVLTPHAGEMARLVGGTAASVEADRFGAVSRAVALTRQTVLLKGARTLVAAPDTRVAVNPTGSAVLATGGTGDVLSGVIAALLVFAAPFQAACAGAFLHGRAAADLARERNVDRGLLAHEIAAAIPTALARTLAEAAGPRR
jgi:NAD(P)H-hydrate epimerase